MDTELRFIKPEALPGTLIMTLAALAAASTDQRAATVGVHRREARAVIHAPEAVSNVRAGAGFLTVKLLAFLTVRDVFVFFWSTLVVSYKYIVRPRLILQEQNI